MINSFTEDSLYVVSYSEMCGIPLAEKYRGVRVLYTVGLLNTASMG